MRINNKLIGLCWLVLCNVSYPAWSQGATELSARQKEIQQRFADQVNHQYAALVDRYNKLSDTFDGRQLGSDNVLELSPDYLADPSVSEVIRASAQEFIARRYAEKLAVQPRQGERLIFSGGGTGAGKTTSIKMLEPALANVEIIYDTTLSDLNFSVELIERSLKSGRAVTVIYIYREPLEAFVNGVLPRAAKTGRTVGCPFHVFTHVTARKVMDQLEARYAKDPRFELIAIDNSRGPDQQRMVALNTIPYPQGARLGAQINSEIDKAKSAGKLNAQTLASTTPCTQM
ncbi:MAG: zeta toxin family protein [Betaproteobacteria bacterium]